MEEYVKYAKRVAFRMSKDPEVESIAAKSAWRAMQTYDGRIPWQRWVARCVKQDIWCYWRELRTRQREETQAVWFWQDVYKTGIQPKHTRKYELDTDEPELNISQGDWRLLVEKYVDKWPLDVMAREYDVTIYAMRKMLSDAIERLQAAL